MPKALQESDLRHVIYALSDALDLVGVNDVAHGKRVGIMAAECGRAQGLTEAETTFLFDLGMLHDIGVSSTQTHHHLVAEFDWEGSQVHAEIGYGLLSGFAPLSRMAIPVRYHHTRWEKLTTLHPSVLTAQQAQQANLIFMVDRVDALSLPYYSNGVLFDHLDEIREHIQTQRRQLFFSRACGLFSGGIRSGGILAAAGAALDPELLARPAVAR
jgi:response regulator RpfG family c-di-GMP phosphodiesterase